MMDENRCTCEEIEDEEHTCPFREDIYGDDESKCTCCPYCTQICADDI